MLNGTELPVDQIIVRDRARKDTGDLTGLKQSITEIGLLQPIGVTAAGGLVFGGRRLQAMRELGWQSVPVKVLTSVTDAITLLQAELDENMERSPFTALEAADLRRKIRELRAPGRRAEVAEQVATHRRPDGTFGSAGADATETGPADVDKTIQAATGFSPATLRRVERIRALTTDADPEVQTAAENALAHVAAGAAVNRALEDVVQVKNVSAAVSKYPALAHVKAEPAQVLRLEKYLDDIAGEGDAGALQEELDGLATMWASPDTGCTVSADDRDTAFEINQILTSTVNSWGDRSGANILPRLGPSLPASTARSWHRLADELAAITETIRTSIPTPTGTKH